MANDNNIPFRERAILVGTLLPGSTMEAAEESLEELGLLTATAGAQVLSKTLQRLPRITPSTYIGKGKAEQIAALAGELDPTVIIFDDDLSPAQARNLERITERNVVDRSGLILDIFALHARTREAQIQVELAQLEYLLPRLTRRWPHLERQEGAIGTRGPGETQLEVDRRAVRKRITKLRRDLKGIDAQRSIRLTRRAALPTVALVGYTNAGKSSILNALSGADVAVADRLFATLDTTVRRVMLGRGRVVLISDTVGFIRKLPHHLVASFRSTLKEAAEADLLLHVVDVSHPAFREQMVAVGSVLSELAIDDKPLLLIFNKVDMISRDGLLGELVAEYPESVAISALRRIGLKALKDAIRQRLDGMAEATNGFVVETILVPAEAGRVLAAIHERAQVLEERMDGRGLVVRYKATAAQAAWLRNFRKTALIEARDA